MKNDQGYTLKEKWDDFAYRASDEWSDLKRCLDKNYMNGSKEKRAIRRTYIIMCAATILIALNLIGYIVIACIYMKYFPILITVMYTMVTLLITIGIIGCWAVAMKK